MGKQILTVKNIEDFGETTAALWKKIADNAILKDGKFSVALSGGSSPIPVFQKLCEYHLDFPWKYTHIFQVDERYVAQNHEDNNFAMIKKHLIDNVEIPKQNIHQIPVNSNNIKKDTKLYQKDIEDYFNMPLKKMSFDLIILGIGNDGHTASLFPGKPVLKENAKAAAYVKMNPKMHDRITLTYPVLNAAKNIVFIVFGAAKAEILNEVLNKKNSSLPAAKISHLGRDIFYIIDQDAAKLIQ